MKEKLASIHFTFVPCKPFVSDFFTVEKTFAFYKKILFLEEKTFAIFRFAIFEGRNFHKNVQKSRKILPAKVSAPKVCKVQKMELKTYTPVSPKFVFEKIKFKILHYIYST